MNSSFGTRHAATSGPAWYWSSVTHIEISSDNRFTDIVADRFDIGVRLGGDVARDMIAVRIAPDMRMAVVGSRSYLAAMSAPRTLQDLEAHDCIALRLPTHGGLLQWEFTQRGKTAVTRTSGRLVFNTSELMLDAAAAGHGLAWVPRDLAQKYLDDGSLVNVLEELAISYPGYHVYYATRRASPALTLVVDALRPQTT